MGRRSHQPRKPLPHLRALHSVGVGKHRLPLSGLYESIEIGHQAWDRRAFAGGAPLGRHLVPPPKCLCQPPPMKNKKRGRPIPACPHKIIGYLTLMDERP